MLVIKYEGIVSYYFILIDIFLSHLNAAHIRISVCVITCSYRKKMSVFFQRNCKMFIIVHLLQARKVEPRLPAYESYLVH